ncbi:MAG: hypothetical protein OCD03_03395 [Hyphomicrobiales bacterium]
MSGNLELVEYFINEFYSAKKGGLDELVTPTFALELPNGAKLNYRQYVEYIGSLYNKAQLNINGITNVDDVNFEIAFSLETLLPNGGLGIEVPGVTFVKIKNSLLENIKVTYDFSGIDPTELEIFKENLPKINP